VGVVGAGPMGGGIAEVCANAGADVLAYEPTEELTPTKASPSDDVAVGN
jgi:3-hydroxybutyryl-CoA dehydrogenase